jgi:glycosyltransferase involved in cell wall biosynthesis
VALHELADDATVAVDDAGVAVLVGPVDDRDDFARCVRSLLAHTAPGVPIVVLEGRSVDTAARRWLVEVERESGFLHDVYWWGSERWLPLAQRWNRAAAAVRPADVVLLHPACVVADGWLDGLRDAVRSLGNAASATALSNHAAFVSVPRRNLPWVLLPSDLTVDEAARRVRTSSLRLRPRLPTALNHCAWLTRAALDLGGDFDIELETPEDALIDFSQACIAHGLQHVLADDVFVMHRGGAAPERDAQRPGRVGGDPALAVRRPYFDAFALDAIEDRFSALARALSVASRALTGLSVTVDGRCLTPGLDGTRIHALELIGALVRSGGARVRVVVPDELGPEARAALTRLDDVSLVSESQVGEDLPRTDIVHRTSQVVDAADLAFLDRLGERIVITNQDLIGYRSPEAFASASAWLRYRRVTAQAMAVASGVLFFSQDAADDALADDLVERQRARVVAIGVDHQIVSDQADPRPPRDVARLGAAPFLLCLGTRFRHKNLVFALRLFERLRVEHGWDGQLVIAGAEPEHGTSSGDEAAFLGARREVGDHVVELASISEPEKRWLLERATAVLYPTTYEGFGLVPFEAARAGTPCLFAHVSSLRELLPLAAASIIPWDPAKSAQRAIEVLRDPALARQLVDTIRRAGEELTWDTAAQRVLAAYTAAADAPAPAMASVLARLAKVEHDYWALREALGPNAVALVGPDKRLLDDETQWALAQIASRRLLRTPVRAALRAVAKLPPRR